MTIRSWYRTRARKSRMKRALARSGSAGTALREFIYLDDVSVYSLLASRLGPIATEFTDRQAQTLNSELGTEISANAGFAAGRANASIGSARSRESQVVRKSIVQTAFKELRDLEEAALELPPAFLEVDPAPPLSGLLSCDAASAVPWLARPETLERGVLVEAEIELESEDVFRVNVVVSTLLQIL